MFEVWLGWRPIGAGGGTMLTYTKHRRGSRWVAMFAAHMLAPLVCWQRGRLGILVSVDVWDVGPIPSFIWGVSAGCGS